MPLEIVKMEEAEALLTTAHERLYSARDRIGEARYRTIDYRLEEIASEFYQLHGIWNEASYTSWKNNLESFLCQNRIPQASAIGHIVGYLY